METNELLSNLCYHDPRNPDCNDDDDIKKVPCFCDNCFYGRHELALEILRLRNEKKIFFKMHYRMQNVTREKIKKYKLRSCYQDLNFCFICHNKIKAGQRYYDGGYSRRAHSDCVE